MNKISTHAPHKIIRNIILFSMLRSYQRIRPGAKILLQDLYGRVKSHILKTRKENDK